MAVIERIPPAVRLLINFSLLLLVGYFDYATGDYGVTIVYLLPLYVAARLLGRYWCLLFLVLSCGEMIGIATVTKPVFETMSDAYMWNCVLQSIELAIIGVIMAVVVEKQ